MAAVLLALVLGAVYPACITGMDVFNTYQNGFLPLANSQLQYSSSGCPMAAFWTRFSGYPSQVNQEAVQHVTYSPQSNCTADQYRNISNALIRLWKNGTLEAPKANRLSFHSAATFTAASGPGAVGGPNGGWFQFPENMNFPENSALQDTISILLNLTREHTCITFADIVFFAGAVLTEAAGGPPIAWMPGRLDAIRKTPSPSTAAIKQSTPPLAARLPDASFTIAGVLYFYTQMGFSVREMVAINGGGHSFGGADPTGSGWNGSFTQADDAWPSPKNAFFTSTFSYLEDRAGCRGARCDERGGSTGAIPDKAHGYTIGEGCSGKGKAGCGGFAQKHPKAVNFCA